MDLPDSSHIVWKILTVILIFLGLALSKYLGYEQWDSWKDIKAALVETLGITLLLLARSSQGSSK